MSDLPGKPPPTKHTAGRTGRRARFVLPPDDQDERVGEGIEAFLEGPPARQTRRPAKHRIRRPQLVRAFRRRVPMDTRTDWEAALHHEAARVARYGRPTAVLVVRLRMSRSRAEERYATRVGAIVREHARETDRVTRAAPDRFHVLMPETVPSEADALLVRVRDACARLIPGQPGADLEILAVAAGAAPDRTLHDALQAAEQAVAD